MSSLINKSNFSKYTSVSLKRIENPKFEDLLFFGNIVVVDDSEQEEELYYIALGNIIPSYVEKYFEDFNSVVPSPYILMRPYIENGKKDWCYMDGKAFSEKFPLSIDTFSSSTRDKVISVLKSNISLDDIKTTKKLWDTFKLYSIPIVK